MRHIAMSLLIISVLAFDAVRLDAGAVAQTATQPLGACSLLPKDLVMKVSGAVNKLVLDMPPQEEPVGTSGSACDYADIRLQIDAFSPAFIDQTAKQKKDWVPVPGVGDRAYFHNNRNLFAELIGYTGARTFTIQMGVPFQGTAEQMKPNTIALANAIIPKLK